ncbi:leucine-rich repeat domain-containing protein [uncultured Prevotella sp.]|uniref:leucine-rich repeat domain-containing protein n=1 Tax=uncultured Prevotella sp. TaxID=159272 RepID=UPI0026150CD1|nr:leucine-rich repeat domain-containing protein [uncultured Prevotella sp.]
METFKFKHPRRVYLYALLSFLMCMLGSGSALSMTPRNPIVKLIYGPNYSDNGTEVTLKLWMYNYDGDNAHFTGDVNLCIDGAAVCKLNDMWGMISNVYSKDEKKIKNFENSGNVGSKGTIILNGEVVGNAQFKKALKNQKCPYNSNTGEDKWTTIELQLSFNNSFSYRTHTVSVKGMWRDRCDDKKYNDKEWDLQNTLRGFVYPTKLEISNDFSNTSKKVRISWWMSGWTDDAARQGKWLLYKYENNKYEKIKEFSNSRYCIQTFIPKEFNCFAKYYVTFKPNVLSEKAIISGLTESCTKGGHELINNERCTTCDHSFFRYTTNDRRMVSLAPNMDFGAKMLSHTIDNTGNCTIEFETPITQIPDGAFKNTSINNYFLRIPSSVATIGAYAFANTSITGTLTFQNVTEIGEGAFENCKNISYLNFGFSLKKIGDKAFNGCTFPINLSIPNTVTEIGNYAFYKCGEIRKLTLPTSLERIGSYAFADCKNIGGNLLIPSSVKEIGDGAFSNCIGFFGTLEMTHPSRIDNLIKIGKEAFAGVRNITGALMIPNTVKEIGDGAFRGCISFDKHLTLSKNLTKIGKEAFSGCKKLIGNLSIPNTVTEIGDNAFYGCEGLNAYLTISDKLQRIGNYVFYGCSRLIGGLTIPNSVTEIGDYAFYNCGGLNGNLTLPTNLKKIGDKAFASCSKLHCEELVLPATLESFGEDVFQGNPLIKRLVFQSLPKGISNNIWNAPKLNKYVSLSDASYINDIAPYQVKEASYSRTMSNTWGTLVLPYKMTLTGNEPYSLFVIDHITPNELVLRRLSGEVKAGTACVVRRDGEQQTMIFTANDATLNTTMQPTAAVEGLNFQGTYHAKEVNNGYIIRNGLLWDVAKLKAASPQTEAIMVGPFRSWLDGTITNSAAKLSIRVDDSATGIDNPISSLNADDVEYYDLNGRRLTAPQQGINIMKRGNKTMKVIIK